MAMFSDPFGKTFGFPWSEMLSVGKTLQYSVLRIINCIFYGFYGFSTDFMDFPWVLMDFTDFSVFWRKVHIPFGNQDLGMPVMAGFNQ